MTPPTRCGRLRIVAACALAVVATACQPVASDGDRTTTSTTVATTPSSADAGFIAFGDAGMADATQLQVADQMRSWVSSGHRVDALVEAGDDVYPDGDPGRFASALDAPYTGLRSPTRPLWVALGNHDVQAGHGTEQLDYLGLPALPYAKTLTGVQLLFLDANHPDVAQKNWLDGQLAAPGPALRIVVFHQPAYSCASHGSTQAVIDNWVPTLEKYRVALVINGHDHYYERFTSANGVTYVVTGGGGAAVYARQSTCTGVPPSQATAARHHFVGVEITGSTLTLTAVARTGETLDTATITR